MKVKGIGNGYWRAVGTVQELLLKAEEMRQKWLCGIGFARLLKQFRRPQRPDTSRLGR